MLDYVNIDYTAPTVNQQHELHHTDQEFICPALSRHKVGIDYLYDLSHDLSHELSDVWHSVAKQ